MKNEKDDQLKIWGKNLFHLLGVLNYSQIFSLSDFHSIWSNFSIFNLLPNDAHLVNNPFFTMFDISLNVHIWCIDFHVKTRNPNVAINLLDSLSSQSNRAWKIEINMNLDYFFTMSNWFKFGRMSISIDFNCCIIKTTTTTT